MLAVLLSLLLLLLLALEDVSIRPSLSFSCNNRCFSISLANAADDSLSCFRCLGFWDSRGDALLKLAEDMDMEAVVAVPSEHE